MAVIYGIRAKDCEDYFYIGCTSRPLADRFNQHMMDVRSGRSPNRHFIHKVRKVGRKNICVEVIEETTDGLKFDREQHWIEYYVKLGVNLTNLIHNGTDPRYIKNHHKYSVTKNWDWLVSWYTRYINGDGLVTKDPSRADVGEFAQSRLADVVSFLLTVHEDEREAAFEYFE